MSVYKAILDFGTAYSHHGMAVYKVFRKTPVLLHSASRVIHSCCLECVSDAHKSHPAYQSDSKMSFETWSLFCLASLLVIMIPGPLSLLMISNSLNFGIKRSMPAFIGGTSASLILLTASATGLGALLAASENLFAAIRYAGALYLIWLGYKAWREASQQVDTTLEASQQPVSSRLFVRAFTLGISNPKDILFFVAFLPQFISPETAFLPQLLIMCVSWCLIDLLCKLTYGITAKLITPLLKRGRNLEYFNRASAGLFVGVGSLVLVK